MGHFGMESVPDPFAFKINLNNCSMYIKDYIMEYIVLVLVHNNEMK